MIGWQIFGSLAVRSALAALTGGLYNKGLKRSNTATEEGRNEVNEQPFNQLTPAELERLALLSEELGEAQQAIGKIMRHGYRSFHPDRPEGPTNRDTLERELGDVLAAMILLGLAGDIDTSRARLVHAQEKLKRVRQYTHHQ